jgi:hypothetical protein
MYARFSDRVSVRITVHAAICVQVPHRLRNCAIYPLYLSKDGPYPFFNLAMSIARCIARIALGCALFVPCTSYAADDSIPEDARKHFAAGVSLLQDPDGARYEDAYREFEAAYSISLSPKVLGNIGYCALKLERDGEAIAAYARYLQEIRDIEPAEAQQISRDVATLRAGLVRVTINVDAPAASVADKRVPVRGDTVTNRYGPVNGKIELGLRPGHHIIEVLAQGEVLPRWEFDAQPGATLSQTFVRKPTGERHGPSALAWIVSGVGAATLIGGGVTGAVTLGKVNAIGANCPNNQCPASYALQPAQDDVRRFIRITDTLLIGGGVIAATGLWLLVSTSGSVAVRPTVGAAGTTSTRPLLSCSPMGCTYSGVF